MYNKKSDYAVNKRTPDAIVYTDADGTEIKLTRDDFDSEEEFIAGRNGRMRHISRPRRKGADMTITPFPSSMGWIHTEKALKMS